MPQLSLLFRSQIKPSGKPSGKPSAKPLIRLGTTTYIKNGHFNRYLQHLFYLVEKYLNNDLSALANLCDISLERVMAWRIGLDFPRLVDIEFISRWSGYSYREMISPDFPPARNTIQNAHPHKWYEHPIILNARKKKLESLGFNWKAPTYVIPCEDCDGIGWRMDTPAYVLPAVNEMLHLFDISLARCETCSGVGLLPSVEFNGVC